MATGGMFRFAHDEGGAPLLSLLLTGHRGMLELLGTIRCRSLGHLLRLGELHAFRPRTIDCDVPGHDGIGILSQELLDENVIGAVPGHERDESGNRSM